VGVSVFAQRVGLNPLPHTCTGAGGGVYVRQSLCWGSYFLAHCLAAEVGGLLQKYFGSQVLYASVSVTCLLVFWPALRGWLKVCAILLRNSCSLDAPVLSDANQIVASSVPDPTCWGGEGAVGCSTNTCGGAAQGHG
jgi:hypothetical protein